MDSVGQVYGHSQRVNGLAMGAVMNGNVNQEKKKINLGCGQAQRFGGVRPASKGTRFKTREVGCSKIESKSGIKNGVI